MRFFKLLFQKALLLMRAFDTMLACNLMALIAKYIHG